MAEEKKADAKDKKPVNAMLLMQIGFAVINLTVVGWGAFMVYKSTIGWHYPAVHEEVLASQKEHDEHGAKAAEITGPLIYTMDKFTVNLNGAPKRTIRFEVNVEMLGKDGFEELINADNKARARDRIVRLFNSKSFDDVESIQGKLFLKDKIAMELNSFLDKGVVKDVYFSEFVVQ